MVVGLGRSQFQLVDSYWGHCLFVDCSRVEEGESDYGSVDQGGKNSGGYLGDFICNLVGLVEGSVGQMVGVGWLRATCGRDDGLPWCFAAGRRSR